MNNEEVSGAGAQQVETRRGGFWRQPWWVIVAVVVAMNFVIDANFVRDAWKEIWFKPSAEVAEIEDALKLTATGKRIFAAAGPTVEDADGFNAKCGEHDEGVSVLGCYSDGRIYIYRITDAQLAAANKVTAAHELLHATWARMGAGERGEVEKWLEEVRAENAGWFEGELETYKEEDVTEEIYTRAGTKLAKLPEGLEKHYAKWFQERGKIVAMFQEYEAPFAKLRGEILMLYGEIERARAEIETEREKYVAEVEALDARVEKFNACANTAGCFSTAEFNAQRGGLVAEREALEDWRARLNAKIDENNRRVDEYGTKQEKLGGLYEKLDSNVKKVDGV